VPEQSTNLVNKWWLMTKEPLLDCLAFGPPFFGAQFSAISIKDDRLILVSTAALDSRKGKCVAEEDAQTSSQDDVSATRFDRYCGEVGSILMGCSPLSDPGVSCHCFHHTDISIPTRLSPLSPKTYLFCA
jgi:hypothetical protein